MISLRPVLESDRQLLWEWANDPAVRAAAFAMAPITWEEHRQWFSNKLHDPNCHLYIVLGEEGAPIGQVRFDIGEDGGALVDLHLADGARGRGFGRQALQQACSRLFATAPVRHVTAQVKLDNQASLQLFKRAGFIDTGTTSVRGTAVRVFRSQPEDASDTLTFTSASGRRRRIGPGEPTYLVAEVSANHGGSFDQAVSIIQAAKQAGADAIKLQTYTPDTMTIRCRNEHFQIKGTVWEGANLYELYGRAFTPWEWQPELQTIAHELGLDFFSTPFDETAVEFLERLQVPLYKVASFENVDLPLLRRIAATKKPVIISTGLATREEIAEAMETVRAAGGGPVALLKCTSAYPAQPEEMHLRTIPEMRRVFGVPIGLSDHSLEPAVPVAAVALGACIIEKHLTISRGVAGPDSGFSLQPDEFQAMASAIRATERALGEVRFGPGRAEMSSLAFRRSLFLVKDVKAGERLTGEHVRAIRPGFGLHPRHKEDVIGRRAKQALARGTPLAWELLEESPS